MVVNACNPRTWVVKVGGPGVQGQPWLPSLDYIRPSQKNETTEMGLKRLLKLGVHAFKPSTWGAERQVDL